MANMDVYLPFDTGPGANVTEDGWRKMMRHVNGSQSGVCKGFQNDMQVYADSTGMQVKVKTGECLMRGHYGSNDTEKILPIAAAHATLARIDRVIIRADFLNNVISLEMLTGTAASTPAAPAVTQSSTIWETSLATVSVAAASVTVAAAAVIDDRVFTSAYAKYRRVIGTHTDQSIPDNVVSPYALLSLAETTVYSGDVQSDFGDRFVLKRSGLWAIGARARFAANGTGGRQIQIVDFDNRLNVYGQQSTNGNAGMNSLISCTASERFAAGKKISVDVWQNSGGALAVNGIDLTFMWVGP